MSDSLPAPDFRLLFESAPGLYLILDPAHTIVAVSDAYLRATMTRREDIIGRGLFDVFPDNPNDPEATGVRNLSASLMRVKQKKTADTMAVQKYDIRKPESEGGGFEERYWSPCNTPVLNAKGEILYIIHQVEDVTELVRLRQRGDDMDKLSEDLAAQSRINADLNRLLQELRAEVAARKRAEESRLKTEEKFLRAFRSTPDSIAITTMKEGRYLEVNDGFLRMTGFTREEVIGRTAADLGVWMDPKGRDAMLAELRDHGHIRDFQFEFRTKNGETRIGSRSAERIILDGQECMIGVTRDITDSRRLEEQLRQAQKMEAIGQLAGGVAHDFNNMLGVILGYSELLRSNPSIDENGQRMLEQITDATQRAAFVTRQLLSFARRQVLAPEVLDLNQAVAENEKFLRRLIPESIRIELVQSPEAALVRADPTQVVQILMNLAVNARDAMPDGGTLTIEISEADIDEAYAHSHYPVQPGRYVRITVQDTGCGMDQATQARIFEPFFTTKGREQGTGLGLATVYGIVKQSGGYIWVYSELGDGTIFRIYLPRVAGQAAQQRPASPATLRGNETILLVEDSKPLRGMYREALEILGYKVLEAENGESAEQVVREFHDAIDLLVTDLVMPGISGRELARRMQQKRPNLKALFMSGYSEETVTRQGVLEFGIHFLQKPFSNSDLGRKIRQVLETGPEVVGRRL